MSRWAGGVVRACPASLERGANVVVSVRPEQLRVQAEGRCGQLAGTVKMVMPLGPQVIYDVEIADGTAVKISQSRDAGARQFETGSTIHFAPASAASCHIFPAQTPS